MRSPGRRARVVWAAALVAAALASAGAARAEAPPAARPPGLTVTLTPARGFMLLGSDADLTIDVEVTGPGAETFAPTRTFATVGGLEALQPTGAPGHFKARYVAPTEHFPQVALLVVVKTEAEAEAKKLSADAAAYFAPGRQSASCMPISITRSTGMEK